MAYGSVEADASLYEQVQLNRFGSVTPGLWSVQGAVVAAPVRQGAAAGLAGGPQHVGTCRACTSREVPYMQAAPAATRRLADRLN